MDAADDRTAKLDAAESAAPAWAEEPRADERAVWTLIGAIGQLVLAGWCLMVAGIVLLAGMNGLAFGGLGSAAAATIMAFLAILGGALGVAGMRFLRRGARGIAITARKARFLAAYRRHGDIARAGMNAEGDPALEGYLRYLVRRGIVTNDESFDGTRRA